MKFKLNRSGGADVLRRLAAREIHRLADAIAADVRTAGVTVEVRKQTTDRARALVTIAEPRGAALEAKHGYLRRAALRHGLELRGRR